MVHFDNTPLILIGGIWAIIAALALLFNYAAHRKDEDDE